MSCTSQPKSSSKRKRSDAASTTATAATAAPAADLKSWMRDVIAAPIAPEDAPTQEQLLQHQPVEMEVDDEEEAAAPDVDSKEEKGRVTTIPRVHFTNVRDLFTALQSTKPDTIFGGLVRFHRQMKDETTQFSSRPSTSESQPQTLLAQYWSLSPDAKEIFAIFDTLPNHEPKKQNQILPKLFDVLARMILPSTIGFNYALSQTFLRKFIRAPKYFGLLTKLVKMSDQRLVQPALYFVLHVIMCCGSNVSIIVKTSSTPTSSGLLREFVTKFPWNSKWWLEIPYKPYQSMHGATASKKQKDITPTSSKELDSAQILLGQLHKSRQIFIQIIVELLSKKDVEITTFILQVKGYITSVLKHLHRDPLSMLGNLDAFLHSLIHDILYLPQLPISAKFGFFNSYVLEHLMELFKAKPVGLNGDVVIIPTHSKASKNMLIKQQTRVHSIKEQIELIERFMKEFVEYLSKYQITPAMAAIMRSTIRPGMEMGTTIRQYGPLLLRILHTLHSNENATEQSLALQIVKSFPPQILGEFLTRFSYTFDPRASFRWINNIDFIGKIWSIRWEDKLIANKSDEFPLINPYQPLHGSVMRFIPSNAQHFPLLFVFLLPITLSQRIILSQCVQHSNSLVKYSTLSLLRSLLKRFGELQQEYEREWKAVQGTTASAGAESTPVALQSSLLTHRMALGKILPDVQVLFGLRTKIIPGQSETMAKMQADLQESMKQDEDEADEGSAKKKPKLESEEKKSSDDKSLTDSATSLKDVVSTMELALYSRHLLYSRFLSVLSAYAEYLPEVLIEGRIDCLKLLPNLRNHKISWWSLSELLNIWNTVAAWKQAKLFVMTQLQPNATTAKNQPQSSFGELVQLYHQMTLAASVEKNDDDDTEASDQIVNGHEHILIGADAEKAGHSVSSPHIVVEKMKEFLIRTLVHTGLFSGNNEASASSTSTSSTMPPAAIEEIHLWLSSLQTSADVKVFELLITSLVNNSNVNWMRLTDEDVEMEEKDDSSKKSSKKSKSAPVNAGKFKLSLLISTAASVQFKNTVTAAGLEKDAFSFVHRFLTYLLTSSTLGSEALVGSQIERVLASSALVGSSKKSDGFGTVATLKKEATKLVKDVSEKITSPNEFDLTLTTFQVILASSESQPKDMIKSKIVTLAESTKNIFLTYARETLLQLISDQSNGQAIQSVWQLIEGLLRSPDFDSKYSAAPASEALIFNRFSVLLSKSLTTGHSLLDDFQPSSTFVSLFSKFIFSFPPSAILIHHTSAFFSNVIESVTSLSKETPTEALTELPIELQLLQQSLPYLSPVQLEQVSHDFCEVSIKSGHIGWIQQIASLPSATEAKLAEELLSHGGAHSIQLLSELIMASRSTGSSSSKKSKKSIAPTIAPTSFVLEELLLKLLTTSRDSHPFVSQLQPTFFQFVLESIYSSPSTCTNVESGPVSGSELYASLGAIFLRELSAEYVPLFVEHFTLRFEKSSSNEHQPELLQLLPLLVRAAQPTNSNREFRLIVQRALGEVFIPFFLSQHTTAAKNPSSPLFKTLSHLVELVKVIAISPDFDFDSRQQLLQFVLTGTKPDLLSTSQPTKSTPSSKKKPTNKKSKKDSSSDSDSSSSSSDDDSDEEMEDAASSVPVASSSYESFDPLRFHLAHSLLTVFSTTATATDEPVEPSSLHKSALAQSYCFFLSQSFHALYKSLKARAKAQEKMQALTEGGDVHMETVGPKVKGLLSEDEENKLVAAISELLTSTAEGQFASESNSSALAIKWVTMLPIAQLLTHNPNSELNTHLLTIYSKIFSALLRYSYTHLAHITLLRNCLLWQLNGLYSRNAFIQRIVPLKSNHHFTITTGEVDDKGELIEEPEVPSLLSICALAASPQAEDFKPIAPVDGVELPTAQGLFELIVSHSKFVGVIAPNAVQSTEEESVNSAASSALQLEYLRLLLLLFSFPDQSPPCDFKLQSNLWLLLFATYSASTSTADSYIKLLLDLFEDISLGVKVRKQHKKMEYDMITSYRRWGQAGLQYLSSKMYDPESASAAPLNLQEMDPSSWLYPNFTREILSKGPIVSQKSGSGVTIAIESGETKQVGDESGDLFGSSGPSEIRYDPSFLLPFFHHFFTNYSIDARRFIELHGLGYIIQCMSHASLEIRRMAYACMGKFQTVMEAQNLSLTEEKAKEKAAKAAELKAATEAASKTADGNDSDEEINGTKKVVPAKKEKISKTWEAKKALYHDAHRSRSAADEGMVYSFKEYPQLALLLTALKNGITEKYQLLPGILTSFLSKASTVLLRPDHGLYKSINKFLLARPMIDLRDIPLFYTYFHSSTPSQGDFKLQRSFILRVLSDGFITEKDYDLLQRRHVTEILLAFIQNKSGLNDRYTRTLALSVIEAGIRISPPFLAELVRVHGFYPFVSQAIMNIRTISSHSSAVTGSWLSLLPLFQVTARSLEQIRVRLPEQPEEDLQVEGGEEEKSEEMKEDDPSSSSSSSDDDDSDDETTKVTNSKDEDTEMVDADGVANRKESKTNSSPASAALKALRKRQRQRGQIARELVLLVEMLSTKFHEWLWSERLVDVVAPTAPTATSASSLATQTSIIESVLYLMQLALSTAQRAHLASRRLTNRVQLLEEGSATGRNSASGARLTPFDQYAPIALRPVFLHAIASLRTRFTSLSSACVEQIAQIIELSSPAPFIPHVIHLTPLPCVMDTTVDVAHYLHATQFLAHHRSSMSTTGSVALSFVSWYDLLVKSHTSLISSWSTTSPNEYAQLSAQVATLRSRE